MWYDSEVYADEHEARFYGDHSDPGFADNYSALRRETPNNPRDQACPTCGEENILTRKDRELGYQCNSCADALERGVDRGY